MNYELYHDESKVDGFWHGILLVPADNKLRLVKFLINARNNSDYSKPLAIKRLRGKGSKYYCARAWISIGVAAMASQLGNETISYYTGLRGDQAISRFPGIIGSKFILFHDKDNLSKMSDLLDYGGKVETTFRMGLKGGMHFLGSELEPIRIIKMHFDGYEHYRRHIDRDRIINRLNGLRSYCDIDGKDDLIDERTSNHEKECSQSYDDCQLLQLTDVLIGSFRTVLDKPTQDVHINLSAPVKSIIDRYRKGYARMQNSRWKNSFCMSQSCLNELNGWQFNNFNEIQDDQQLVLFD
jgi:hypothetical protein